MRRLPPPLLLLLLLAAPGAADTVYLKGGKKFRGRVVAEEPEVVLNIYNSTLKEMTLGVHRFPKAKVKKIVRTLPAPRHEFQRRLAGILSEARGAADEPWEEPGYGDGDGNGDGEKPAAGVDPAARKCVALAAWCAERKLKEERRYALEMALRFDPDNAVARKLLGSQAPKGRWKEQLALARRYLSAEEAEPRAAALAEIHRDKSFPFKELYLRRAWRSARQPTGYVKDRPVALRADKLLENARYTLLVPRSYDPLTPTPLVIGLHGGGAGGADGKLVVGTGWQAMNFYRGECERRGWICACPTAVRAGWRGPNDDLIDALLKELSALYNIDENRIYLIGHSMGGGGTWSQGARLPETWAAIAPAASFGVHGIEKLVKTKTGFYVYHSDNDPRTSVDGVRPRMKSLPGSGADFVYTELPGRGHSFPPEVVREIFRFFAMRTLARRSKPQARPRSSFSEKLSRDEKKYLPALPKQNRGAASGEASLKSLLKDLQTGGGVAEQAAAKLVTHSDVKTDAAVARILLKSASGPVVRRYAARVLGGRKARAQLKALGRVLLIETESNALLAVLDAIGEINDPAAGPALLKFLKKRGGYLASRTKGGLLSHSDWETILPTLARACSLVGSYRPEKGAAVIASTVLEGVFLSETRVRFDVPNQHPQPYAQTLAEAACDALRQLGGNGALAALKKVAKAGEGAVGPTVTKVYGPVHDITGWPGDARVAACVREALAELGG